MRNVFALTSHDGRRMSDRDFAGKYRIVYFGYTNCPDVCPVDLAVIGGALRQFEQKDEERAARVQPIFITSDPARDTPQVLRQFVDNFHPRLIGFTGTAEEIGRAGAAHRVSFERRRPSGEDEPAAYFVDHSRYTILYGPEGEPIVILPVEEGPAAVLAELEEWAR